MGWNCDTPPLYNAAFVYDGCLYLGHVGDDGMTDQISLLADVWTILHHTKSAKRFEQDAMAWPVERVVRQARSENVPGLVLGIPGRGRAIRGPIRFSNRGWEIDERIDRE